MLQAGKLRHRVVIQRQQETRDMNSGAVNVVWVDVATVWAAIEPISAREFIASDVESSRINTRITVRYRNDLVAKMRLYHASKNMYYDIEGVLADKDSGLEYLTLPCSEGLRYLGDMQPDLPPVNVQIPVISPVILEPGEIASVSTGVWINNPTGYAYQWYRNGNAILGATSSTYIVPNFVGDLLSVSVTASNDHGQNTAFSEEVEIQPDTEFYFIVDGLDSVYDGLDRVIDS